MRFFQLLLSFAVLALAVQLAPSAHAEAPTKDLLDLKTIDTAKRASPQYGADDQVSATVSNDAAAPGVVITIKPGKAGYPGLNLKPAEQKAWDLSAFGHVEARVVNTGSKAALFAVRIDNAGNWHNNPWNTEQTYLKPGERATIKVIFGHQYNHKPGYALNPKAVVNILMFTGKADNAISFRVESLVAGGSAGEKPPVDPASIRTKPANGMMLGTGVNIDGETQIEAKGTKVSVVDQSVQIVFPAAKGEQMMTIKPPAGRWDLRDATEVRVKVKNEGESPVTPSVQLASNTGPTGLVTAATPLAAGAEQEITVSFIPTVAGKGVSVTNPGFYSAQPGTGTNFTSDTVGAVKISAKHEGETTLLVESIVADAPAAQIPDWLGKRPPVDGNWVRTFDDEFNGRTIDGTKWNIYGPNFWDQASHWSKDNVIVGDGVVKLRYDKKTGYHNDDPKEKRTGHAAGFLETYGKWVQRYGYFEARMKLPTAPGLWPAFWMMADRGVKAGSLWVRQDTGNGGMEFDIMEHLTRWGPYRYNIALHWDGYQKDHKSVGSDKIYIQPDKDGFITCGLLWIPGAAIYYADGREVFRWESPRVSNVQSYMMLTLPIGGWDNNSLDDKQLPADFVIDYVRVWQRKDLASSVDGYQPATKPDAK